MHNPGTVILIGSTDIGRRTCEALQVRGVNVTHLASPSDAELHDLLTEDVIGVAVMLHSDIEALRYSLAVEHIKPGVRLFVAIFDRSVRHEMERTIPNIYVASPAFIAMPSIIASALLPDHVGLARITSAQNVKWETASIRDGEVSHKDFMIPASWKRKRLWSLFRGQLHSYDSASRALLGGLAALVAVLLADMAVLQRTESLSHAFYSASAVISGVTAPEIPMEDWQLIQAGIFMLLTVIFIAIFGAGMVNHVLTGRRAGIVGRRVIPRSNHIVVVGLGQVGIRVCRELALLKVAVVAIEQDENARGVHLARDLNIPVVIGNASDIRTLNRARVAHSQAILAMGSQEQDNIAVAVAARTIASQTPIILRAGNNDAIAETRSLFSIGVVADVNGMTAAFVAEALLGEAPRMVVPHDSQFATVTTQYALNTQAIPGRCVC